MKPNIYCILVATIAAQACAPSKQGATVRDPYDAAVVAVASSWTIMHDLVSRSCNARLAWLSDDIKAQVRAGQITTQEEAIAYANAAMSTCSAAADAITRSRQALDALLRLHAAGQGQPAYCAALLTLREAQKVSDRIVPLPATFFRALDIAQAFGGCR